MANATQMPLDEVRKKFNNIDCFFTYYDGEKSTFDFYGTNASGVKGWYDLPGA